MTAVCGFTMHDNEPCQRPPGHTRWSIETGWFEDRTWTEAERARDLHISAYAHCARRLGYDDEVARMLTEAHR